MSDNDEQQSNWHLDKRVPVAIILGMLAQFAGVVAILATMYNDVQTNAENITLIEGRLLSSERATGSQAVQLGRIEEAASRTDATVNRILDILERRND